MQLTSAPVEHPLAADVRSIIRQHAANAPRSQQRALGPSQIGEPCDRRLAMTLMGEEAVNTFDDPLPSVVGTAAHTWMESAVTAANERLGRRRYLTELSLPIASGIRGSCDCYDMDQHQVVDWKFPGSTRLKEYQRHGPGALYRTQGHLYGYGARQLGLPVSDVSIVFLPRGGLLTGMHVWSEPYDETIATDALQRYWKLVELCVALDVSADPSRYEVFQRTPTSECNYCPFHNPYLKNGNGKGCPGGTLD